jgi:hypothetical protein
MFPDYQRLIVEDYEQKKAANTLSQRLIHPTPARLREECVEVFRARFEKRDENTLKGFFGERNDEASYLQAIERCDIDRFRPLIKFLKKDVINSDVRNIELLAWLINFEPRPWEFNKEYTVDAPAASKTSGNNIKSGKKDEQVAETEHGQQVYGRSAEISKRVKRKIIAVAVIALLCSGGYYILKGTGTSTSGNEACMYWNVDHYEAVSCNKKMASEILVVALDTDKVRNFKRIMRPDTITHNSIGKVWYVKIKNRREYYTSGGNHPRKPELILKPITDYIISHPDSIR